MVVKELRSSRKRRREVGWAEIIHGIPTIKDQQAVITSFERLGPTPEILTGFSSDNQEVTAQACGLTGWGPTPVQQINLVSNRYLTAINF